jgi:hypothetical protein
VTAFLCAVADTKNLVVLFVVGHVCRDALDCVISRNARYETGLCMSESVHKASLKKLLGVGD